MNLETPRYKYALEHPFEVSCFIYFDSNKKGKRLSQNGADSIPTGKTISCLKTSLTKVCLVKYLLPASLEVQ